MLTTIIPHYQQCKKVDIINVQKTTASFSDVVLIQ